MASITDIKNIATTGITQKGAQTSTGGEGFGDLVKQGLQKTLEAEQKSQHVSMQALAGKADMTEVLQATTDLEMSLKMVLAIKDKLVQFNDSVMRTNI